MVTKLHRRFLGNILGVRPVSAEPVGEPEKHGVMPLQPLLERSAVAALGKPDEIEIAYAHVFREFDGA